MVEKFKERIIKNLNDCKTKVCSTFGKGENNNSCMLDNDDYKKINEVILYNNRCGLDNVAIIKNDDKETCYVSQPMFNFDNWKSTNNGNVYQFEVDVDLEDGTNMIIKDLPTNSPDQNCTVNVWVRGIKPLKEERIGNLHHF